MMKRGRKRKGRPVAPGALDYAFSLLSYRERSEGEVRQRLALRGYPQDAIDNVVSELTELNYLDDKRFSLSWLRSRRESRPGSRSKIRWELLAKGVKEEVIAEALDEEYPPEEEAGVARKLAEKRASQAGSTRKRIYDYLRRRGFGHDVIMRTLEEVETGAPE